MGKYLNISFTLLKYLWSCFTAFYVLHHPTIAQFSLVTVNITENRRITIASKTNVIRPTSVQATYRCIQIITAKTRRFIRKAFNVIEPQRSVWFNIVFSMVSVQRTFTVEGANTLSRTKPTWVRQDTDQSTLHKLNQKMLHIFRKTQNVSHERRAAA